MIELFLMMIAGINGTDGPADIPIQGIKGDAGCSGNPNPPSEIDVWKYKRGVFTPRQDDIRIGSCYSPINTAFNGTVSIIVNLVNGTEMILVVNTSEGPQK